MSASSRRWVVLGVGVLAQTAACAFVYGVPFLVPTLRDELGLSLAGAGVYVAAPTAGLLLTLIAWGAAADRHGERRVLVTGLALTTLAVGSLAITQPDGHGAVLALLGIGGAAAASVFAASGRMIMGWFPRSERGLAMGIRQTATPLGVAVAGLVLPGVAQRTGALLCLLLPAGLCLLAAVAVLVAVRDPVRPNGSAVAVAGSPYRQPMIWRVHAASALLVVPQFAFSAFGAEYLVRRQGWGVTAAGAFLATVQIAGALSRISAGVWSDRVGSRLAPMRRLAIAAVVVVLAFALGDAIAPWLAVVALVAGGVVTVADNGLAFTAVAEIAGPFWAGRALGVQNTGQNIAASLTPIALGALIGTAGYAAGFVVVAAAPLLAVGVTPVRDERVPTW